MLVSAAWVWRGVCDTSSATGGRVVVVDVVVVVDDGSVDSDSTTGASVVGGCWSRSECSSGAARDSAVVATVIAGDAEMPSAVGTSVTSLRTLPTAAAAIVTATTVAPNQATPIPPKFLISIVWRVFVDSETRSGYLTSERGIVTAQPEALVVFRYGGDTCDRGRTANP